MKLCHIVVPKGDRREPKALKKEIKEHEPTAYMAKCRGDSLKLHWGGSAWILGNISSPKEQSGTAQLPREWWDHFSLEVLQSHGDVALRDVGSGHGGVG